MESRGVDEMDVKAIKHAAKLQEWRERIQACRNSGQSVRDWCTARGIGQTAYYRWEKEIIRRATEGQALSVIESKGNLVQIQPGAMNLFTERKSETAIIVRHGETAVEFPAGSGMEAVADFVKALNRHV